MAVHDSFVALAKRLLEKHGRSCTLRKNSETANDAAKPWRGNKPNASATDDIELTGVKVLFKGIHFEDDPDNEVRRAYQEAVVAADSVKLDDVQVDLTNFDEVQYGTEIWKIDRVDPVKPGEQTILWKLRLKR